MVMEEEEEGDGGDGPGPGGGEGSVASKDDQSCTQLLPHGGYTGVVMSGVQGSGCGKYAARYTGVAVRMHYFEFCARIIYASVVVASGPHLHPGPICCTPLCNFRI